MKVVNSKWEIAYDKAYEKLEKLNLNLDSEYSAWGKDKRGNPIYNLNEVATKGKVMVVAEGDEFFGGRKSKSYQSSILENPTWLDLYKESHDVMKMTGDEHHCFFEGFRIKEIKNGIKVIELVMGS